MSTGWFSTPSWPASSAARLVRPGICSVRVCDLYALATIEADKGWFLEHGRLSARRAKGLTRTVNELCAKLRPHALFLVDGLGIPPAAIDVPLLET